MKGTILLSTAARSLLAMSVLALMWSQPSCSGSEVGNGATLCDPGCADDQECIDAICVSKTSCSSDNVCPSDQYCLNGRCAPYGGDHLNNPTCERLVPAGLLSPQIFCEWKAPVAGDPYPNHKQVLSTPLVIDFNFAGRGSEFVTTRPSILVNTYSGTDGGCGLVSPNYGILRVLDGRSCNQLFVIPTPVNGSATPALGDLDADGAAEIVAYSATGGLVAFKFRPQPEQVRDGVDLEDQRWRRPQSAGRSLRVDRSGHSRSQ
jgi:hypothetical protein